MTLTRSHAKRLRQARLVTNVKDEKHPQTRPFSLRHLLTARSVAAVLVKVETATRPAKSDKLWSMKMG